LILCQRFDAWLLEQHLVVSRGNGSKPKSAHYSSLRAALRTKCPRQNLDILAGSIISRHVIKAEEPVALR
jgi:hypothetical protein